MEKQYDVEIFNNLNMTLKDEINKYAKLVHFKKGKPFFSAEDSLKNFYIILSGKVKVYQLNLENAKEQTIFILSHGDMHDTIALLDGNIHEVISEVLEDGTALCFPVEQVREWIDTNLAFNKIFFPYLAHQMRSVEELATDLSLYSTSERLIKLILRNITPKGVKSLLHNLTRIDIASLIGTVRHVVDRHINELKDDGAIEVKRKQIIIKDIEKLIKKLKITS